MAHARDFRIIVVTTRVHLFERFIKVGLNLRRLWLLKVHSGTAVMAENDLFVNISGCSLEKS